MEILWIVFFIFDMIFITDSARGEYSNCVPLVKLLKINLKKASMSSMLIITTNLLVILSLYGDVMKINVPHACNL